MIKRNVVVAVLFLALGLVGSLSWAQGAPDQQPIFTYVAEWGVPRTQWGDMEKLNAGNKALLDSLVADGTLLGYGTFENRLHSDGGYTHGSWFQATSLGSLFKTLETIYAQPGGATAPVQAASKHQDYLMVSTIHGAKAVSNSTGYLRVISAELKPGSEQEFVEAYRRYIVPVYAKLLADSVLVAYQLDMEFNIQNAPGRFFSVAMVRDADGLDKVRMAVGELLEKNPAALGALVSATKPNSRSDLLARVTNMSHK